MLWTKKCNTPRYLNISNCKYIQPIKYTNSNQFMITFFFLLFFSLSRRRSQRNIDGHWEMSAIRRDTKPIKSPTLRVDRYLLWWPIALIVICLDKRSPSDAQQIRFDLADTGNTQKSYSSVSANSERIRRLRASIKCAQSTDKTHVYTLKVSDISFDSCL